MNSRLLVKDQNLYLRTMNSKVSIVNAMNQTNEALREQLDGY